MTMKSITKSGLLSRASSYACQRSTLQITELNRREDYGDLEQLARFIRYYAVANGYLPGTFSGYAAPDQQTVIVTDGFRRTAAYDLLLQNPSQFDLSGADLEAVQGAKFRLQLERSSELKDILSRQIVANAGKPFTAYEQAKVIRDMEAAGITRQEITELTGMPASTLSERLSLLLMPEQTAEFVVDNFISTASALVAIRKAKAAEPEEQGATIQQILESAKAAADEEGVAVGRDHVELAAVEVLPRPAVHTTQPMDRNELLIRCGSFDNWEGLSSAELRKVWAILSKVSAGELPQSQVQPLKMLAS